MLGIYEQKLCAFCNIDLESIDHLLFRCYVTLAFWSLCLYFGFWIKKSSFSLDFMPSLQRAFIAIALRVLWSAQNNIV